jgi:hypothetical protein
MTAFVIPNAIQITTRQAKYTFASFLSRDTTFDVIYYIWRLARPEDSVSITGGDSGSFEGVSRTGTESVLGSIGGGGAGTTGPGGATTMLHKPTQCTCGKEGKHYSETALETVLPGTPDTIHNLIFASGFIKDFMRADQKLLGAYGFSPLPRC